MQPLCLGRPISMATPAVAAALCHTISDLAFRETVVGIPRDLCCGG